MARTTFRLTDACQSLGLALGAALVWAFLVGWLTERSSDRSDQLVIDADGTIYVQRTTYDLGFTDQTWFKFTGAGLEPVAEPSGWGFLSLGFAPNRLALVDPDVSYHMERVARMIEPESGDVWHFVIDRMPGLGVPGYGYFVLFDPGTRRPARYIAREGGQPQRPALDQMFVLGDSWVRFLYANLGRAGYDIEWGGQSMGSPEELLANAVNRPRQRLIIVADDALAEVELKTGVVRRVPGSAGLRDVAWGDKVLPEVREDGVAMVDVLYGRTSEAVFGLDAETFAMTTIPVPESLNDSWIGIHGLSADQWALVIVEGNDVRGRQDVARLSADGTLTDRVDGVIPAPERSVYPPTAESLRLAAMTPSLAFLMSVDGLRRTTLFGLPTNAETGVLRLGALMSALFGVVAAVLGEVWTRRFGHTAHPLWRVFLFLFGLPGLLGYILHRKWPARTPAAVPAPNGLEVFAR